MCHETITHLCVPATEKIIRTVAVYGFLVVGLRLAGKRELAQIKAFDLIVLITIANAVQNAIIGPDNTLTGGLIGAATLLAVNNLLVRLTFVWPSLGTLLQGRETVLYRDGVINRRAVRREMLTDGELIAAVRRQGARTMDEVEEIALEPNGNVLVTMKEDATLLRVVEELRQLRRAVERRDHRGEP
jgi:uncharacterized membrane protein YcaP (DUF421 family)